MPRVRQAFLVLPLWLTPATGGAQPPPAFDLRDGDRVAFIGDALIEREAEYGCIETALTARFPDRNVVFRNLGWSGDTPAGAARAAIDPPRGGWDRLQDDIRAVKPTVAVIGYGMASSFDGEAGLAKFEQEMNALLDALPALAGGPVRVVILGPIRHETGDPVPPDRSITAHNATLAKFSDALRSIAAKHGASFVSLFDKIKGDQADWPVGFTDNGIHLEERGYRPIAVAIVSALCGNAPAEEAFDDNWMKSLRCQIVRKNRLYFDRWRPQNAIYLFGSRKHEQGQHVRELPLFDPLVAAAEAEISKLRTGTARPPVWDSVGGGSPPSPASGFGGPAVASRLRQGSAGQAAEAGSPRLGDGRGPLDSARGKPKAAPTADPAFPAQPPSIPFDVADGFEISLFAATPQIAKPIQMNFDPQGRLWVVTSSIYPQIEPGQAPDDKVVILEDTDRDGRADKVTVFADGLRIPTGVVPDDYGCYVGLGTQLLYFFDPDGDGRARMRRVVLSGFGTEDTHHMIHTLRWGPDGCLYFNQSIYINSSIETPHGVVRLARGGIFRFDTRTQRLDVLVKGLNNAWGHCFDAFGQSFAGDASGDNTMWHCVPGAIFWDYAGERRFLPGIGPAEKPKTCGMEIVSGRHLPDDWQGNIVAGDFKTNRVRRFVLRENGSTFAAEEKPNLVRSKNASFRPVDVKMGPDGAIYVADWSNPIINHGEVDFRDPRRDKTTGRIWRVTAKGRALVRTPDLTSLKPPALLEQLKSPEEFTRNRARCALTGWYGSNALMAELSDWVPAQTDERVRLEALWLFEGAVGDPWWADPKSGARVLLRQVLEAGDSRVRVAAVRALRDLLGSYGTPAFSEAFDLLAPRVADDHPRVRLEAVRTLGRIPTARAAALALSALDKPMDPTLDYALRTTIEELAGPWVAALESGQWKWEGREAQLNFALSALPPDEGARALRIALHGRTIPRDGSGPLIDLIARSGGPAELRGLFDRILQGGFDPPGQVHALAALGDAARLRGARPAGDLEGVCALLDPVGAQHAAPVQLDDAARAAFLRLLGRWKLGSQVPRLLAFAGDAAAAPGQREAAFEALREIGGPEALDGLRLLCGNDRPWATRDQAVRVFMAVDAASAAPAALDVLAAAPDEESALRLWRALLDTRGAAAAITRSLSSAEKTASNVPSLVAKTGLRATREMWENAPELALALAKAANLGAEGRELTPEEIRHLAAQSAQRGDPARGARLFQREDLHCLTCHAVNGTGGRVGPDLGTLGAAAPVDYIVESILYPDRKIKEGFHATVVQTTDERIVVGRPVRDTDQELVLLTSENKEVSIAKREIAERKLVARSIMPSGLTTALTPGDFLDLARFLSELGRPGPYDRHRIDAEPSPGASTPKKPKSD